MKLVLVSSLVNSARVFLAHPSSIVVFGISSFFFHVRSLCFSALIIPAPANTDHPFSESVLPYPLPMWRTSKSPLLECVASMAICSSFRPHSEPFSHSNQFGHVRGYCKVGPPCAPIHKTPCCQSGYTSTVVVSALLPPGSWVEVPERRLPVPTCPFQVLFRNRQARRRESRIFARHVSCLDGFRDQVCDQTRQVRFRSGSSVRSRSSGHFRKPRNRSGSGPEVRIRSGSGPDQVRTRSGPGHDPVPTRFRPGFDPISTRFRPGFDPNPGRRLGAGDLIRTRF